MQCCRNQNTHKSADSFTELVALLMYTEEEFLVMGDPQQVYGDSWLLVYSVDTKNGLMEQLQARAAAAEAAQRAIEEEEARLKAEEDAKLNAVYVDKPFIPKAWVSSTEQETLEEVGGQAP